MAEKAEARITPMKTVRIAGLDEVGVGQQQGERRDAEDRGPDDALAAEAVAERAADDRAGRDGEEEDEEKILRRSLDREWNFWIRKNV